MFFRSHSQPSAVNMASVNIDYSLYLDVDSSAEALKGRDLLKVVQGALEGGIIYP